MNNLDEWFENITQRIKKLPMNGTLIIRQFDSNEEGRTLAEKMLNDFAKRLGRSDVKIVAKNVNMN